jgi:hypothetical protein
MKKIEANRYPHSATLFRFCKEALEIRYEGNVKVIDQDVGAILGYDPADCSHWKKGKKNIRALSTLRTIADHLNVDERLLIDIAAGRVDLDEAVFEFKGYGDTNLLGRHLENLKKEFFKNPTRWQTEGGKTSFEELFSIDRKAVAQVVEGILAAGNFTEAPIYLPEVVKLYPNIQLVVDETMSSALETVKEGEGTALVTTIKTRTNEVRPYLRFLVAKEIFKHLVRSSNPLTARFQNVPDEVLEIQANVFAAMLLIPGKMLRSEVERIDSSMDIVTQLAETFWVSKPLMNQRLRDYMESLT